MTECRHKEVIARSVEGTHAQKWFGYRHVQYFQQPNCWQRRRRSNVSHKACSPRPQSLAACWWPTC